MRRLATILVTLAAGTLLVAGTGQQGFGDGPPKYNVFVQFDNASGIVTGVDVKIAGARVGKVAKMGITDDQLAVLRLEVNNGYGPFHTDAECSVRLQSLIGEKFVECSPGTPDAPAIPEGGTLPVKRTHSPVDLDLVNNVLRKPYADRFRIILNEFGTGLAGRGEDLNEVIRRAAPALQQTNRVLRILARQNKVLRNLVEDAEVDIGHLADKRKNVSHFIERSRLVAKSSASKRKELAATFAELPLMLRELGPTMRQLGNFAGEFTPVQRDLGVAANDLARTVKHLGEFSESSGPAFETLGEASKIGNRALTAARPLIRDLRPFAKNAVPIGVDLAEFLEASDSRDYAVETNPASPGGKGYTALEGILNYIFYQQTAINGFDELGYFLRVTLVQGACTSYTDKPKVGPGSECRSHLGKPFVNEAGQFEGAGLDNDRTTRRRPGDRKDSGSDSTPAPGGGAPSPAQPPIKLPKIDLPGDLENLLEDVGKTLPDGSPVPLPGGGRGSSDEELLDYLMGS